jgi:hypothetical protein
MSNVDTANGAASQVGGAPASSVAVATTPGVDAGQPPLPPVPCPAEVELPLTALEGRVECAGGTGCTLRATTDADAFDVVCDCVDGVWNDCSVDQCPGTWPDREENTCPPKGLALPEGCSCVGQHWESQEIGQDCVCRQELPKPVDPDAGAASGPVLGCPDTAKFSFTEECGANTVCLNRECAEATTCVMRAGAFAANLECDCVDGAWANCRFLECPAVQGTFFGCAETDLALPEGCTCETGMTDNPDVPGEQIATCTCTQL